MPKQKKEQRTVYVGRGDFAGDIQKMKTMLERSDIKGILIHTGHSSDKYHSVFRPTRLLPSDKEVVKTLRKFLGLISVLYGRAALTVIKDEKKIPKKTLDFDQVYEHLDAQFHLSDKGRG